MNKKQTAAYNKLSTRAKALYHRVCDPYRWYLWTPKPGRYMQELLESGLIGSIGRVNMVTRAFVPHGTRPLKYEKYPPPPKV